MIPVPGVYMIRHCSGRTYVGSSRNVEARCVQHVQRLNFGNHANSALQADWLKDGPDAFTMTLLEPLPLDGQYLDSAERRWTERFRTMGLVYNDYLAGRNDISKGSVRLIFLKRRRLEKGWSLADLARASGMTRQALGRIERGKVEPHPATIAKLAAVLDCRPVALMELDS